LKLFFLNLKKRTIMTFTDTSKTVIFGGSTGIGRAIAAALSARPGQVEIVSRRTGFDISNEESVASFFSKFGAVDHVVVTAGSSAPGGKVSDVSLADAKLAFDTKFWGSIVVAREAAKHIRPGGTITLTSGFLARRTVPGTYVKTAMNAALEAVVKILARELAPIRVNIVSPGLTDTEAYAGMTTEARQQMLQRAATNLPVGRHGTAEDLAQGYLFAIDNPYVTGSIIDIDGGALVN
jgi:NAD(P)-dependent dehydrogenase (short-subunit alcohol dehydrogenase family)